MIVGPEGTPFEGTPFHFDIRFPQEYPVKPPEVGTWKVAKVQGGVIWMDDHEDACVMCIR